jgi:hypothetical protein
LQTNTSLLTDTSSAVTESSVDAYRDQISKHVDNDYAAHTSMQLYPGLAYFEPPVQSVLVTPDTLCILLTVSGAGDAAFALPCTIQPGTYPPSGSVPSILSQPASITVAVGGLAAFSVYVASSTPGAYQWQKNGVNIAGANSAEYAIANVQLTDVGTYTVVVTNAVGSVTSASAALAVTG